MTTIGSKSVSRRTILKLGTLTALGASVFGLEGSFGKQVTLAAAPTDIEILNYALTLEHLEYAFYREGLAKFNNYSDFLFVPHTPGDGNVHRAFTNLGLIRDHEKAHVDTLTSVIKSLGGTPVQECTYDFGYHDAQGFVKVAQALENTGVMAYDGAIALIQKPELRTAGATIATIEARHAAFLNELERSVPFPDAFDTPKTMAEILAIAGKFIVSCPKPTATAKIAPTFVP